MKIVSATCAKNSTRRDTQYLARVTLSSDGVEKTATGEGDEPHEALQRAFSEVVAMFTQPLRDSLRAEITVKF